ncbi:MAG: tetratricopeptide repeat protein [Deltaproteobacteria bacterium]|nr:MAG: tetratricopeptide repeat protein [Deltaproteobacteria bacterium]
MPMMPRIVVTTCLLFLSPPLFAQDVRNPDLKRGIAAYTAKDYQAAFEALKKAEAQAKENTPEENALLYQYLGFIYSDFGKDDEAVASFKQALTYDCELKLPSGLAENVYRNFTQGVTAYATEFGPCDRVPPQIVHTAPSRLPRADRIPLSAVVTDDNAVKEVTLYYRPKGSAKFQKRAMNLVGNEFRGWIEGISEDTDTIEYYIEARDRAGNRAVAAVGKDIPFTLELVRSGGFLSRKTLGWSSLGAGVASGVVAGIFYAQSVSKANQYTDPDYFATLPDPANDDPEGYKSASETAYTISIVTLAIGAGLSGLGSYLLLSGEKPAAHTVQLTPTIDPETRHYGFGMGFRF